MNKIIWRHVGKHAAERRFDIRNSPAYIEKENDDVCIFLVRLQPYPLLHRRYSDFCAIAFACEMSPFCFPIWGCNLLDAAPRSEPLQPILLTPIYSHALSQLFFNYMCTFPKSCILHATRDIESSFPTTCTFSTSSAPAESWPGLTCS
jgi:hypothetical protein